MFSIFEEKLLNIQPKYALWMKANMLKLVEIL